MEINEINNKDLKIKLGNSAINMLISSDKLNQNQLNNIQLSFAYIFRFEDGRLEALFKIIHNENTYYFSFQKDNLMLININEIQYKETIDYMINHHSCLKDNLDIETDLQKCRREKSNEFLMENNIDINNNLIYYASDDNIKMKSLDEICKRAISSLITIQIACDINNGKYKQSLDYFMPMYEKYGVKDFLNSKEKRIIEGEYTSQDIIDLDWAYEAYWSLCWVLGFVDDIKDGGELCDCNRAISFVISCNSYNEFVNKCNLKSKEQVLDMCDLYYRYNWALNNKKINSDTHIGNLNYSNVIERRRGLEWIISDKADWYELSLDV